jgi:hypothetical protein
MDKACKRCGRRPTSGLIDGLCVVCRTSEPEYDWLIFFEDQELTPELFGGTDAFARKVLENRATAWTCHLYKRIASA